MTDSNLGHNRPPSQIDTAGETMRDLSAWMAEHPLIESEEDARHGKLLVDRGKLAVADLEDERKAKVGPLNEEVKRINGEYRAPREQLDTVIKVLSDKLTVYLRRIEQERIEAAERAKRIAEEAEIAAREAEKQEQAAFGAGDTGELGIDIASAVAKADAAFTEFQKADRQAQRAEREAENVRIGGGFRRSLSLREKETLVVVNATDALLEIGITDDILEAITKGARAFRRLRGRLPNGVTSVIDREV